MSETSVKQNVKILSPLRYPGAKRRLGAYLAQVLKLNGLKPRLFVEPFAGGASVSLQLLHAKLVDKIALGEKDPLVASFWKVVFSDTEWLKDEITKVPVTLENWKYYKETTFETDRERALACLFLNRTSFSGILSKTSGPIGGMQQKSEYKIGCRFNVKMLTKRLDQIASLKTKVEFVEELSWQKTIEKASKLGYNEREIFYYFDPPFYEKADRLYRFFFSEQDHQDLHDEVTKLNSPWLLSYDAAKTIENKYTKNGNVPSKIGYLYSTSGRNSTLLAVDELIISNLSILPKETKLWRKSPEKPADNECKAKSN